MTDVRSGIRKFGAVGAALRLVNRSSVLGERGFERELLITGCGASGTKYVAELLVSNGIGVTHDCGLGKDGIVTNACNGKEVWILWHNRHGVQEYVQAKLPVEEFRQRLQVTRHPLKVIGSVTEKWRLHGMIWRHVRENLPGLDDKTEPSLEIASRYWLQWNKALEPIVSDRLRLEDIARDPELLFSAIGKRYWRRHDAVRTEVNTSGTTRYPAWDEIRTLGVPLYDELRDKAASYGYSD